MAKTVHSRAGWGNAVAEVISGNVTLTKNDSGKVFICQAATVTLPSHADAGVGWHATFFRSSGSSTVNSLTLDAAHDAAMIVSDGSAFLNFKTIA